MAVYEIPLTPQPQRFSIQLANVTYQMRLWWNDSPEGGWTLDIMDNNSVPIETGIPLVTGADLLAQFDYLNFNGSLYCYTDNAPLAPPSYTNLGTQSHVYFTTQVEPS